MLNPLCSLKKTMCCSKKDGETPLHKACCICLPYNDAFFITAQITSIFAVTLSWIWVPQWSLGMIAMVVLQVPWCCRMKKCGILMAAILAFICAAFSIFTSIYVLIKWKGVEFCKPMVIMMDDDYDEDPEDTWWSGEDDFEPEDDKDQNDDTTIGYFDPPAFVYEKQDWCHEGIYSGLALADAMLWLLVGGCVVFFLYSGRFQKVELQSRMHTIGQEEESTTELEMRDVEDSSSYSGVLEEEDVDRSSRRGRGGGYVPVTLATASESTTSSAAALPLRKHEYQPL